MSGNRGSGRSAWIVGDAVGFVLSIALHAALITYVAVYATVPELEIEFELPSEVEFGVTEGMTVTDEPLAAAPDPEVAEDESGDEADEESDEGESTADAGRPSPLDAGQRRTRDAGVALPDAGSTGDDLFASAGSADAGVPDGALAGIGTGEHRELPPGAQLALRMDMARIRRSPLSPNVRELLTHIPEWHRLLDGSGIDPVDDLDRVLIASPNLDPDRVVVAGRYEQDRIDVRQVVERMATARGQPTPSWEQAQGVELAPWPDLDEVERVIAIIGPRHFAISRREDLARVLAFARARAAEGGEHPADALLSMPAGAGLTMEVEGARRFARGARGVPSRLSVLVAEQPDGRADARVLGTYDDATQARDARDFWERQRSAYASNFFVMAMGMAGPLRDAELEAEGDQLRGHTTLTAQQIRLVLSFLTGRLRDRARRRPSPPGPEPPPDVPTSSTD